ncbi:MAG: DUF3325 domain-containing protein [Pseudomonadota bacterium]
MSGPLSFALLSLATILCGIGMALLALSQDRNWRAVGVGHPRAGYMRGLGWAVLSASLAPIFFRDGPSFAALIWPMLIAACAITVAMVLTYRPGWLRPLAALFFRNET